MASEKFNKTAKEMVQIMDDAVKTMELGRDPEFGKWLKKEIKEMEKEAEAEEELRKALAELQTEANEINEEFRKLRNDIVYVNGVDKPVDGRKVAQLIDRYFKCLEVSQQLAILVAPYMAK